MSELSRAVDQLRQSLDAIGPMLNEEQETAYLEEFKATLDRVRTSVQAIGSTTNPAQYSRAVVTLWLRRAAELCQGVLTGISDGTISRTTPGFARLRSTVEETLEALEGLKRKR